MNSEEEEAPPPPFEPKLVTVAKWFRDRQLSYDKRIEDVLIEWGVDQLEDIKLVEMGDWEGLLQYPKIKWKRFEKAFGNLKADEFNELKSDSIPIRDASKDAGTGAKQSNSNAGSIPKKRGSCGNNGSYTMKSFYSKKQKSSGGTSNATSSRRSEEDDDGDVEIIDDDDVEIIDDPADAIANDTSGAAHPAIEAYNWRSGRDGVEDVEDPPSDLERRQWEKYPISGLLSAALLEKNGYTSFARLDDVGGLYQILGASRDTSDEEMEQLVKKEGKRRRDKLSALHPDRGGDKEKFNEWSNKWDAEYKKAVEVLGSREER